MPQFYTIFLLIFPLISTCLCDHYCPHADYQVPTFFNFSRIKEYDFSDGTLQIFSQIKMPCDGWITEFRWLTRTAVIEGLNIAIFRQRIFEPVFDLVGDSLVDKMATPHGMTNIWVQYRLRSPISVRTGDCFGVFYNDVMAEAKTLSIVTREDSKPLTVDQPPTYVLFSDGNQVKKTKSVDVTSAIQTLRDPALIAIVSGFLPVSSDIKPANGKLAVEQLPRVFSSSQSAIGRSAQQQSAVTIQQPPVLSPKCYYLPRLSETFCWRPRWRYYYEIETSLCRQFYGCRSLDPEANNFDTRQECRQTCPEIPPRMVQPGADRSYFHAHYGLHANQLPLLPPPPPPPIPSIPDIPSMSMNAYEQQLPVIAAMQQNDQSMLMRPQQQPRALYYHPHQRHLRRPHPHQTGPYWNWYWGRK